MKKNNVQQPALHKVIMVGSGGVGKSALTLQFMYDEVSACTNTGVMNLIGSMISKIDTHLVLHCYSLLKTTNQLRPIRIGRKLFWMVKKFKLIFWTLPDRKIMLPYATIIFVAVKDFCAYSP